MSIYLTMSTSPDSNKTMGVLKTHSLQVSQIWDVYEKLHRIFGLDDLGEDAEESQDQRLMRQNSETYLSPTERVRYLNLTEKLYKVESCEIYVKNDPSAANTLHYFKLSMFINLKELKLDMIPPSTILDLHTLRDRVVRLEMVNSGISDLRKVLAKDIPVNLIKSLKPMVIEEVSPFNDDIAMTSVNDTIKDEEEGQKVQQALVAYSFNVCEYLKLRNCGIAYMDAALQLFPNVETMDLSNNDISHILHLHNCHGLRYLHMSRNRIRVLSNLGRVIGNLIYLGT